MTSPPERRPFHDYCPDGKDPKFCSTCIAERVKESRRRHQAAAYRAVPTPPGQQGQLPAIPDAARPMHIYVPGKTRHGKSTLLFWMALQDMKRGYGVCVIDPKPHDPFDPNLAEMLLDYIPPSRKDDVIWLDLRDPIALDFMSYDDEREKERLIGELRYLLTRQEDPLHAPLMSDNIANVLYTILDFNENPTTRPDRKATLLDIQRFLTHAGRRAEILSGVTDPELLAFWREGLPQPIDIKRIRTRTNKFTRQMSLRKIFDAPQPKLNIARAIREKKILLVHLGGMDETQQVYGTLVISKIRDTAYRGAVRTSRESRYFLYCDEFQKFQTQDFPEMLSMAGGLGLSLTLSHQYVDQLKADVLASITGNISSFIIFRLGAQSVAALRYELTDGRYPEWSKSVLNSLATLPVGRAIYRDYHGRVNHISTILPPQQAKTGFAEYIKKRTVEQYASPMLQVSYTEANERHARADDDQADDKIEPGGPPNIPPQPDAPRRPRPRR